MVEERLGYDVFARYSDRVITFLFEGVLDEIYLAKDG